MLSCFKVMACKIRYPQNVSILSTVGLPACLIPTPAIEAASQFAKKNLARKNKVSIERYCCTESIDVTKKCCDHL